MDRRSFLMGLVATTTLAACPAAIEAVIATAPVIDFKAYYEQWMKDALSVLADCWSDMIIYGTSVYRYTDAYPFVERIDPRTLSPPHLRGGLFND
jgi:hypothetical protein